MFSLEVLNDKYRYKKNAKRHETNYQGMLKQFLKAKSVD
ncbi:hypothetical protein ECBD561099_2931 [Escherichia coli Bd5610_99]|nr:hypothetical protein ECBD561099_2931 [Escherichia coli Bd5610_99]